jgi:hypothetical protein
VDLPATSVAGVTTEHGYGAGADQGGMVAPAPGAPKDAIDDIFAQMMLENGAGGGEEDEAAAVQVDGLAVVDDEADLYDDVDPYGKLSETSSESAESKACEKQSLRGGLELYLVLPCCRGRGLGTR